MGLRAQGIVPFRPFLNRRLKIIIAPVLKIFLLLLTCPAFSQETVFNEVPVFKAEAHAPEPIPIIQADKPANQKIFAASGTLVGRLDIGYLHNRLWRTALSVRLGDADFRISAEQGSQGGRYITLYDTQTGEVCLLEALRLVFGGGYHMTVDGIDYKFKISPNIPVYKSNFVVRNKKDETETFFEIQDIMKAMYEAGEPVHWGDKDFRVHYTDQIIEDHGKRLIEKPLLVLMKEQPGLTGLDRYKGDGVAGEDIPGRDEASALLKTFFRIPPYDIFPYGLKKTSSDRILEVYSF